ncbi:MAG: 1-deoxy-D-xylulose-5-phosphate reductoisomerase [Gammaproteobacteria bacterium]|nr:1-deoxy-D-xylulose-5-phosphate reductoisomerase [Gammaproteobacteria bacterium]
MTTITILGATGTIGVNTLDVIGRQADSYRIHALTARRNINKLFDQCVAWQPRFAVVEADVDAAALSARLRAAGVATEVLAGAAALAEVASAKEVDCVMAAIVGAAGLLPNLAAVEAGKRVLLANKEALVMSGPLFTDAARRHGATVLPIDSEHNAIFQCLPQPANEGLPAAGVKRLLLTGSGGPFRTLPLDELETVTPEQACRHPNWVMGRKISVDSATMMNKGLEIIEACWLFDVPHRFIEVVVHPQSVIHSMVEYLDGSVLAQLGNPDMRTPIAHALAWPRRIESGVPSLDFFRLGALTFDPPDEQRFPCLRLAREAIAAGGNATAVLNAANEEAVAAFLDQAIPFTAIARLIERALERIAIRAVNCLDEVLEADREARLLVRSAISETS